MTLRKMCRTLRFFVINLGLSVALRPPATSRLAITARTRSRIPFAQEAMPSVSPNVLQSDAIRSTNKAVLVLASAGTGKTRVLRARIAYLLLSEHVPSNRILTVAFSQHAVQQLRTRVGALTGSTQGMWLGTFHSAYGVVVRQDISAVVARE